MIKFKQIGKWAKNKGLDAYKSAKHAVSNPKDTATKAINYVKSNPDEAIMMAASGPGAGLMAAHEAKKGNKKEAAIYGAIAAAPIGSGYIVGKKAIKGLLKSKRMSRQDDLEFYKNVAKKNKNSKAAGYLYGTGGGALIGASLAGKNKLAGAAIGTITGLAAGHGLGKIGDYTSKKMMKDYAKASESDKRRIRSIESIARKYSESDSKNPKLSGKDLYKARAAYIPVTAATYIGGRMLAKKLGASNITKNYAPLIPAIAAGRLTKKAIVGRLKDKNKEN